MGDNKIPPLVVNEDWEVPATLNKTWGYKKDEKEWKTPGDLILKLVDIVSKGGNYLLNVEPMADGIIPQASQDNLRTVGKWLKVNGESIYGASPTPFGEEPGKYSESETDADGKPKFLPKEEWRCAARADKLYIHLFKQFPCSLQIPPFKSSIRRAYMLADRGNEIHTRQIYDGVVITLPRELADPLGTVVCLELEEGS